MSTMQQLMEDPHYRGLSEWAWDIKPQVLRRLGEHTNPDAGINTPMFLSSTGDASVQMRSYATDRYYRVDINPAAFNLSPRQRYTIERLAEDTNDPYGVIFTETGQDRFDNTLAMKYKPYLRPRIYQANSTGIQRILPPRR